MAETPVQAGKLKPGNYVMAEGEPCKVVSITKSKPGKHGSAKVRIEAMGIFDNRRHYILKPASATINAPVIEKKRAQVISVSGDVAQLMDLEDYSTFDATVPEELRGKLDSGTEVLYWKLGNKVLLREVKS